MTAGGGNADAASDAATGLTAAEAARRLAHDGPNELSVTPRSSVWRALRGLLREPLFGLLFLAAGLYFWLGDRTEALALLASAAVAAAINVVQGYRTERVLLALRDLASPRARVLRDGAVLRIPSRDLVVGDMVLLAEGDRVPADLVLHAAEGLLADESLLTGESVPVPKFAGANEDGQRLFASTLVSAGHGRALVVAVGAATRFGHIGAHLCSLTDLPTPLQRDTARLARGFGLAGALLAAGLALGLGLWTGDWVGGLLRGLTLAMAILPEEFPLVITVLLALGAWRMARQRVLTRRAEAIEALGAATVLCVDKTGTLTLNRMTLQGLQPAAGLDEATLAHLAACASEPQAFDPMDRACLAQAQALGRPRPADGAPLARYALRRERLVAAQARATAAGGWQLAAKGAPEHVLALCTLDDAARAALLAQVHTLAGQGLRLLAVARAEGAPGTAPPDDDGLSRTPLEYAGLLLFMDPLRPEVPASVAACHEAGIRLLMITGDHAATAAAIARQAGLAGPAETPVMLDGPQLEAALAQPDGETLAALRRAHGVARATPLLKLRLVQALQAQGEVVAMTGDGVNDAPALRAAHIGVAMGERGCDLAREAAGLVLLQDDFRSLVGAVRQGRRIFANLRQALLYILAVHVPIVGLSLLPALLGAPVMLMPLHIMFFEFMIDPTCSLAFEAERERDDAMRQPPRPVDEPVLATRHLLGAALHGGLALLATATVFVTGWRQGVADDALRGAVLATIMLLSLGLVLLDRRAEPGPLRRLLAPNPLLWAVVALTLAALAVVFLVPPVAALFRVQAPVALLPVLAASVLGGLAAIELSGRGLRRRG